MPSNAPLRVFVVDDETPARKKILRFLSHQSNVQVLGEAANGHDAIAGIRGTAPDLIFLDIEMPDMDGFAVLEGLAPAPLPRIVFVTAHDGHTMRAFQVHAFDYLLKPFDEMRFSRVLQDARDHMAGDLEALESGRTETARLAMLIAEIKRQQRPPARLLVQENGRAFFLSLEKIDWAESDRNYLNLHVGAQTYTIRGTIESLQAKLDAGQFLRVNRSAIVRLDFVSELQNWSHGEYQVVLSSGKTVTWTRRYLDQHPELLRKL